MIVEMLINVLNVTEELLIDFPRISATHSLATVVNGFPQWKAFNTISRSNTSYQFYIHS